MCSLTAEKLEPEREQRLIFPSIDRRLALAKTNTEAFITELGDTTWVRCEEKTGKYARMFETQFDKIVKKKYTPFVEALQKLIKC